MKKYAKLIIALGLAGGIMLTGCQKNESGSAEPTATPEPSGKLCSFDGMGTEIAGSPLSVNL